MSDHERARLLSELDEAVRHVGQSISIVAAQEKRVAAGKLRGSETSGSESLLATFRECLRLQQNHSELLVWEIRALE